MRAKEFFRFSRDYPEIWSPEEVGRMRGLYRQERLDVIRFTRPGGKAENQEIP